MKLDKVFNNKNKASDIFGTPKLKSKNSDHYSIVKQRSTD